VEASAIQAGPGLGRPRIVVGTPLLRLRSDQQLVTLFREGNEEAFRVIHDRYRPRLLAYVRQMLPGRGADVEDALQDVFVRTYAGLRTTDREIALRPWLYRVAHNRCIDELRRPQPVPERLEIHDHVAECDPVVETERRESLRRLVADIGRLPEQQRSALLLREISGMAYAEVACALGISVPAVKSLLVRARIGLAQAVEARDAACVDIRRELAEAHEEGVRPSWMARRHLRDCPGCRACRAEIRTQARRVAALAPTVGPLAVFAKLFGVGTGAGGGTATAASAGGATAGAASGLATVTAGHVVTILAAAVVTAGGAVAVQQTVAASPSHHTKHAVRAAPVDTDKAAGQGRMRVPALIPAAARATHPHAAPVRDASEAAPRSHARSHVRALPAGAPGDISVPAQSTTSDPSSTTCTPPPPPPTACTASEASTCSTGSGSTTSSGGQATPTGETTTTGQGTTTTGQTATTPGSGTGSTSTGTTPGSTSGTGATTTGATCTSTGTQATEPTSTGTTGSGGTGTGGTGSGTTGSTEPVNHA
jgi:RNA polymerase sigma factor (sigma-70 family)